MQGPDHRRWYRELHRCGRDFHWNHHSSQAVRGRITRGKHFHLGQARRSELPGGENFNLQNVSPSRMSELKKKVCGPQRCLEMGEAYGGDHGNDWSFWYSRICVVKIYRLSTMPLMWTFDFRDSARYAKLDSLSGFPSRSSGQRHTSQQWCPWLLALLKPPLSPSSTRFPIR